MNVILFDDPLLRTRLLPLTFTRPVADLRVGILTLADKWRHCLNAPVSHFTQPYLRGRFPLVISSDNWLINGAVLPTDALVAAVRALSPGGALTDGHGTLVAARLFSNDLQNTLSDWSVFVQTVLARATVLAEPPDVLRQLPDIFLLNGAQIRADFARLTHGRPSAPLADAATVVYNPGQVFLEPGVQLRAAVLNAERGPIYLGHNVQVMEGAVVRGPFAALEGAVINAGAKMIGDNTIGPYCKVGGEVSNCVLWGYSNKAHDGFLGNSVLGEWCNLGAATNTSNMKNTFGDVKLWNYATGDYADTGRMFCGLVMGDHAKAGIGTLFNTGTVVGVAANIFGTNQPPKFVPSFRWGATDTYRLSDALATAVKQMARRNRPLTDHERAILTAVFEQEVPTKP